MTFYELEKICKKRRLRKIIVILTFIIILIALFFIIFQFITYNSNKKINTKPYNLNKKNSKKEVKRIKKIKKIIKIEPKEEVTLMPVLPDINFEENTSKRSEKNISKIKVVNSKKSKPLIKTVNQRKMEKNTTNLIEVETLPSYNECIKLAKKYLKEKKFNLALKWAKNANIQNKTLPDSWIITSKALFYKGEKNKAIKILKIYLNYKKNKEMEKLLKEFENEKNN